MRRAFIAILFAAASITWAPAYAVVDITVAEVGTDVVFNVSGSLDITGFAVVNILTGPYGGVDPNSAYFFVIPAAGFTSEDIGSLTGFAPFGTGGSVPGTPSGSIFGIGGGNLNLPSGYSSFDPILSTLTIPGQTFASLGLDAGVYTSGLLPSGDFIRLTIPTIPIPASMALVASGLAVVAAMRAR